MRLTSPSLPGVTKSLRSKHLVDLKESIKELETDKHKTNKEGHLI